MSRETAITEEYTYRTTECRICDTKVAIDEIPHDVKIIDRRGYVVFLGEGKMKHKIEDRGNWNHEFHFELDKENMRPPTVKGYIICEECADKFHQYRRGPEYFTGEVPSVVSPYQSEFSTNNIILYAAIIIVVVLLIMLL